MLICNLPRGDRVALIIMGDELCLLWSNLKDASLYYLHSHNLKPSWIGELYTVVGIPSDISKSLSIINGTYVASMEAKWMEVIVVMLETLSGLFY